MDQPQPEYLDDRPEFDPRQVGEPLDERSALTEELLEIGRELAELPVDGAFGRKVDLRERQKELRQRLAALDDVVVVDEDEEFGRRPVGREQEDRWDDADDEDWIDLERDGLVTTELPPDRFRA